MSKVKIYTFIDLISLGFGSGLAGSGFLGQKRSETALSLAGNVIEEGGRDGEF